MIEIIPAIIEKDYESLKNKIALVRGIAKVAQIDICDGVFVPTVNWPFLRGAQYGESFLENSFDEHFLRILNEQEGLPFWEDVDFELDLMVSNVVENFDTYMKLGARRMIFHLESVGNLEDFKDFLEGIDVYVRDAIEIGVAMKPSTPTEVIFPLVNNIDFVQLMGNDKIAHKGVPLDEKVYEKLQALREKYSDLPIAVDIGVNEATAPKLVLAGATKLVAGSAIFNTDDIISTMERFRNL